jgi:hypothetical protein
MAPLVHIPRGPQRIQTGHTPCLVLKKAQKMR